MSAKKQTAKHMYQNPTTVLALLTICCGLILVRCSSPATVSPIQTDDNKRTPVTETTAQVETGTTSTTEASTEIKAMFEQGIVYYNTGQYDKAITQFVSILEKDPSNLNARSNLGAAYFNTGNIYAARREFEIARSQAPDDPEILYNLGAAKLSIGDLEQAMQDFRSAERLSPNLPDVHIGMGNAYHLQGEKEAGIRELEKALELAPNAPWRTIVENQIRKAQQD